MLETTGDGEEAHPKGTGLNPIAKMKVVITIMAKRLRAIISLVTMKRSLRRHEDKSDSLDC